MLIDTHAHLNFPEYQKILPKIIHRAINNNVRKIICVGTNLNDSQKTIEISKKYPGIVFAAVGIHPQEANSQNFFSIKNQLKVLKNLASQKEVKAIGECGLDFPFPSFKKSENFSKQRFLFEAQIEIALKLNKPLLIHSRHSFKEIITILEKFNNPKGIFHCYSGGKKGIVLSEKLNFLFGVAGNFTYEEGLKNVFSQIPLEKIVIETDCPFLTPLPFRGKRNEPAYLKFTAQSLAKNLKINFKELSKIITENTQRLLGI